MLGFGHDGSRGRDPFSSISTQCALRVIALIALVLERVGSYQGVFAHNAWRGAALACARLPREFRLNANAAEACENRRLPRITQRDATL